LAGFSSSNSESLGSPVRAVSFTQGTAGNDGRAEFEGWVWQENVNVHRFNRNRTPYDKDGKPNYQKVLLPTAQCDIDI
jgi:hypothetical protein